MLVTGASRGFGRVLALTFAQQLQQQAPKFVSGRPPRSHMLGEGAITPPVPLLQVLLSRDEAGLEATAALVSQVLFQLLFARC